MKSTILLCASLLVLTTALGGCATPQDPRVVDWYGSYNVDDEMQLRVTTLGMSQMQYELLHVPSNRIVLKSTGSSFDGWFFVWDEHGRLWGYWNDLGAVVWSRDASGVFQPQGIYPGSPVLKEAPPQFAAHLPEWARRTLGI